MAPPRTYARNCLTVPAVVVIRQALTVEGQGVAEIVHVGPDDFRRDHLPGLMGLAFKLPVHSEA